MSDMPYITRGASSEECLDAGLVCSIDPATGNCTECGQPEFPPTFPFTATAVTTVLAGDFIPAHDETFDLAETIGQKLDAFQHYVAKVRDPEQAKEAVKELLTALLEEASK